MTGVEIMTATGTSGAGRGCSFRTDPVKLIERIARFRAGAIADQVANIFNGDST